MTTLADMARTMEHLRRNMIILRYHLSHIRRRRGEARDFLSKAEPMYQRYSDCAREIEEKKAERRSLKKELAALPVLSVFKRSELKKQIARLSEEIEELTFSKNEIMAGFGKEDEKEMPAVPKRIATVKANVAKMDKLETRYTGDIEKSGREFNRLKEQGKQYDLYDLTDARLALRPQMEDEARESIKKDIPDEKISLFHFQVSVQETDKQNHEDGMESWYKEQTLMRQMKQARKERTTQRNERSYDMGR